MVSDGKLNLGGVPSLPDLGEILGDRTGAKPTLSRKERGIEARRVVKRMMAIVSDYLESASRLDRKWGAGDFHVVTQWLRSHAASEEPDFTGSGDEIRDYLRRALFDELVLEPGNVLLATPTGPESIRYDAMDADFWRECIDLFESQLSSL